MEPHDMPTPSLLYVDDDPDSCEAFRGWCDALNFPVEICTTAEEALSLVDRGDVGVLLSDGLAQHRMTGLQLLARARDVSPATLRVSLSGRSDDEYLAAAAAVAHICFTKPAATLALEAAIRQGPSLVDLACAAAARTAAEVDASLARMEAFDVDQRPA